MYETRYIQKKHIIYAGDELVNVYISIIRHIITYINNISYRLFDIQLKFYIILAQMRRKLFIFLFIYVIVFPVT